MASGHTLITPAPSSVAEIPVPTRVPVTHASAQTTNRTASAVNPAIVNVLQTRIRRETGSDSRVSRYRRSSAATVNRVTQRTTKSTRANGTIRLSISALMYCSMVSSP